MVINFLYGGVAGGLGSVIMMIIGYKLFDMITPYETGTSLREGNIAVAIVICGFLIGVGVATGLSIGLGLN